MIRAGWLFPAVLMLLAACQPDAPAGPEPRLLPEAERAACLAAGGSIGRGGLLPDEVCFKPTPDAGKACSKASDCSAMCLAETRSCSKVSPQFGCFGFLDDAGQVQDICVD